MSANRLGIVSVLFLSACSNTPHIPAPIIDKTSIPLPVASAANQARPQLAPSESGATYTVKAGDGLYRIALENGLAYKDLATWNSISDANALKVGQVLRLSPPDSEMNSAVEVRPLVDSPSVSSSAAPTKQTTSAKTVTQKYPKAVKESFNQQAASTIAEQADGQKVAVKQHNIDAANGTASAVAAKPIAQAKPASKTETAEKTSTAEALAPNSSNTSAIIWGAPTAGKVITPFTVERKGIDIAGQMGQSIVASGSGKVVYAGAGLRGYGKMIIIQHADGFLSAYAHNSKLIVKENDVVKKGEKIAEMGNSDSDQVKLHFELRKFGKPVDPSNYIKLN